MRTITGIDGGSFCARALTLNVMECPCTRDLVVTTVPEGMNELVTSTAAVIRPPGLLRRSRMRRSQPCLRSSVTVSTMRVAVTGLNSMRRTYAMFGSIFAYLTVGISIFARVRVNGRKIFVPRLTTRVTLVPIGPRSFFKTSSIVMVSVLMVPILTMRSLGLIPPFQEGVSSMAAVTST